MILKTTYKDPELPIAPDPDTDRDDTDPILEIEEGPILDPEHHTMMDIEGDPLFVNTPDLRNAIDLRHQHTETTLHPNINTIHHDKTGAVQGIEDIHHHHIKTQHHKGTKINLLKKENDPQHHLNSDHQKKPT